MNSRVRLLRFTERGFKCRSCGAHGNIAELAKKIGAPTPASDQRSFGSGVTLSDLARTKGLPIELLESLGWHSTRYSGRPAVAIPYREEAGVTLREQLRLSLGPGEKARFAWAKGQGIYPLGLDALVHARSAGWVLIEEGATDYAACFDGGIPAIGVPGANTWKSSWSSYLEGIENVFVWMEPGVGGRALVKAVSASRPDALIVIAPPESNDPCDLHQMHGEGFSDRLIDLLIAAEPAETVATDAGVQQESTRASGTIPSVVDRVLGYVDASGAELFHDEAGEPYIAFDNNSDRREIWPLRSKACADYIRWLYYRSEGRGLSTESLNTVRGVMAARSRFEGSEHRLSVRVAWREGALWYDLGDWRAVRIDESGWEAIDRPSLLFRHFSHQSAQVSPSNGSIGDLFDLINVSNPQTVLLLKVYLVAALLPEVPLPLLVVYGEQGTAKSMLHKLFKQLIDPSVLGTLTFPQSYAEFVQLASHHRAVYFDNLTSLPQWLSDGLCRLCTGDGFSKRELYTDDDDVIYRLQGLGGINGINVVAVRPDVLDRSILVRLDPIPEGKRLSEAEIMESFNRIRPGVLGDMFQTMSRAMAIRPRIQLDRLPRLADFALWGVAIAESMGESAEAFLQAYEVNVEAQNESAIEESPVAQSLLQLMESREIWEGTSTDLVRELTETAGELGIDVRAKTWPKRPNTLSRRLNEVSPNLRRLGIEVSRDREASNRIIRVSRRVPEDIVITVMETADGGNKRQTNDDTIVIQSSQEPIRSSLMTVNENQTSSPEGGYEGTHDDNDDNDDSFPTISGKRCSPLSSNLEGGEANTEEDGL